MQKTVVRFIALLFVFASVSVYSSDSIGQVLPNVPTKEALETQKQAIETDASITQESKDRARKNFEEAVAGLIRLEQTENSADKIQQDLNALTTKTLDIKSQLEKDPEVFNEKEFEIPASLEKAEDLLYDVNATYDEYYSEALTIREAIQKRNSKIASIAQRKSEIASELHTVSINDLNEFAGNLVDQMRSKNDLIRIKNLQAENKKLDLERDYYAAMADFLPLAQELSSRKVTYEKKKKEYIEDRVNSMRKAQRQEQARKAVESQKRIEAQIPGLHKELEKNYEILTDLLSDGAPSVIITKYEKQSAYLTDIMNSIRENNKVIKNRIEIAGLDTVVGKKLTEQLKKLPNQSDLDIQWQKVKNDLYETQNIQLRNNDLRHEMLDFDRLVNKIYHDTQTTLSEEQATDLIRNMLEDRRVLLNTANEENNNLIQELLKLNSQYEEMQETLVEMRLRFSEELIWVQSDTPFNLKILKSAFVGFKSVFAPSDIKETVHELWDYFKGKPQYLVFMLLLMLGQGYWANIIPKRLAKCVPTTDSNNDRVHIKPLAMAIFYTFLIPIITFLLCLLLFIIFASLSFGESSLIRHLAWAFRMLMHVSWVWLLVYYLCMDNGLGIAHFGWDKERCLRISKWSLQSYWAILGVILLCGGYLIAMELIMDLKHLSVVRDPDIVEYNRVSFCLISIVLAQYFLKLFHPLYGVFGIHHSGKVVSVNEPPNLVWRRLLQISIVLMSLAIGVGVAFGYELCALCFYGLIMYGMMLFTLAAFVNGIVMIFLKQSQQHMIKNIITKFSHLESIVLGESGIVRLNKKVNVSSEVDDNEIKEEEERKDLESAGVFYQRMTRMTSILIWGLASLALFMAFIRLAPALDKIGNVELWRVRVEVPTETTASTQPKSTAVRIKAAASVPEESDAEMKAIGIRIIRIYDLLAALLYLFGGLFIARNISDILELFLRQLPFSESSRYGVRTITSYVIAVFGIVFCFDHLGVTWQSVQWIIAAASVGLGFGLQDIFSNLVSGLIILVERPIRVGDTVTVGSTSGTVIKISMRATVIRDFDYRELIVPNKLIITGQVINASLSTSIVRSQLTMSYYKPLEDPNDMVARLRELICSINGVLSDPAPTVILDSVKTLLTSGNPQQFNFLIYYYFDSSKHKEPLIRSEFYRLVNNRLSTNETEKER